MTQNLYTSHKNVGGIIELCCENWIYPQAKYYMSEEVYSSDRQFIPVTKIFPIPLIMFMSQENIQFTQKDICLQREIFCQCFYLGKKLLKEEISCHRTVMLNRENENIGYR